MGIYHFFKYSRAVNSSSLIYTSIVAWLTWQLGFKNAIDTRVSGTRTQVPKLGYQVKDTRFWIFISVLSLLTLPSHCRLPEHTYTLLSFTPKPSLQRRQKTHTLTILSFTTKPSLHRRQKTHTLIGDLSLRRHKTLIGGTKVSFLV